MPFSFWNPSRSPRVEHSYIFWGTRRLGQAVTHRPQRMQWVLAYRATGSFSMQRRAEEILVTGTSRLVWATPIIGPPERTFSGGQRRPSTYSSSSR